MLIVAQTVPNSYVELLWALPVMSSEMHKEAYKEKTYRL